MGVSPPVPAVPVSPAAPRSGSGVPAWLWIVGGVLLFFALVCGLFALAVLFPAVQRAKEAARNAQAAALVRQLQQAASMYELDYGAFPPGDGRGSRGLSEALRRRGPKGITYYEFAPGELDPEGNIRNPIDPAREILHYRENGSKFPGNTSDPAVRNKSSFDLWGRDTRGQADGISNW